MSDFFLFERPSFTEGVGRAIDFWGNLNIYNYSETPEKADYIAIYLDWKNVGQDLKKAILEYQTIESH